jgi:hypothetical protein
MYTEILLNKMKALAQELGHCENRISRELEELQNVCDVLKAMSDDISDNAMSEVILKLTKQLKGLEQHRQKVRMLQTALIKVISLYENCEKKILSMGEGNTKRYEESFQSMDLKSYYKILDEEQIKLFTSQS